MQGNTKLKETLTLFNPDAQAGAPSFYKLILSVMCVCVSTPEAINN